MVRRRLALPAAVCAGLVAYVLATQVEAPDRTSAALVRPAASAAAMTAGVATIATSTKSLKRTRDPGIRRLRLRLTRSERQAVRDVRSLNASLAAWRQARKHEMPTGFLVALRRFHRTVATTGARVRSERVRSRAARRARVLTLTTLRTATRGLTALEAALAAGDPAAARTAVSTLRTAARSGVRAQRALGCRRSCWTVL